MARALYPLLGALLLCAATTSAQEAPRVGGGSPEPEPPGPEPEPEPEPKYEKIELHSGSSFFSNYNFVQWGHDQTTHGAVSYATPAHTELRRRPLSLSSNGTEMLLRRYVSENEAKQHHLIPGTSHPSPNTVSWGVEAQPSPRGANLRRSIKLKSKTSFSVGEDKWLRSMLAVIDVAHVPTGCGTWPAFWMANENSWPRYGEVDIIESTNQDTEVSTTLHTCGDASAHSTQNPNHCSGATKCTMESVSTDLFTGTWAAGNGAPAAFNCDINAPGQYQNQGCSIHGGPGTVGSALNDGGGGIFATEWSMKDLSDGNASKDGGDDLDPLDVPHIAMWFFPRKDLPLGDEMWGAQPDTKAWVAAGHKPYAYFRLGKENCDPKHFSEQQLIFDTTLCGDNAGAKWGSSGCATTSCDPGKTCEPQCEAFVRNSSSTFAEAYWEVYNVSVWGVKTGIPRPHPPGTPTEEMSSYVIVVGVVLGMCIVGCCGYKCWVESRDAEFNRVGRRAEINARLADDSGWQYAHEKQSSGRYGGGNAGAGAKGGNGSPAETSW